MNMTFAAAALAALGSIATAAGAATYTVSTPAQLDQVTSKAKGGDTIKVSPGNYGAYEFKNLNPLSAVTIVAANSSRMPVFTSIKVTSSSNLTLARLIASAPTPKPDEVVYGAIVSRSSEIRLSGMVFRGVLGGGVSNEPRGLRVSQSSDVTVSGNSFTELSHALLTDSSVRMNISDNGFTGIRTDGIMTDGTSGTTITRNRFATFRPEGDDHPDAIQFFNAGNATRNVTISDNLMIGDARGQMQGIFMTNASGIRGQLDQVTLSNNLMWGTMYNGIAAFTANRVNVSGNTLYSNDDLGATKTWIRLDEVSSATSTSNYAGAFLYDSVGTLTQASNVLNLGDALAIAAISAWDATHAAAALSLPYRDASTAMVAGNSFASARLAMVDDFAALADDTGSLSSMAAVGFVPEPAAWAMMIAGFGLVGTMRRRLPRAARRRMARG